jgi:hypothetical protein
MADRDFGRGNRDRDISEQYGRGGYYGGGYYGGPYGRMERDESWNPEYRREGFGREGWREGWRGGEWEGGPYGGRYGGGGADYGNREPGYGGSYYGREPAYGGGYTPYYGRERGYGGSFAREPYDRERFDRENFGPYGYGSSAYSGSGYPRSSYGAGWGRETARESYFGRGPRGYRRSDERIREEVNDRLTWHPDIDASDIEVSVENGEVALTGVVENRRVKRLAADIADDVMGVEDVHNQLKVRHGFLAGLTGEKVEEREVSRSTEREGSETTARRGARTSASASTTAGTTTGATTETGTRRT